MNWEPDVPGRLAWTLQGGLVNNSGGIVGYYQTAQQGPNPGVRRRTDSEWCVWYAIKIIQKLLNSRLDEEPNLDVDGVWGNETQERMGIWQDANELGSSGIFGPRSAIWFWRPQIAAAGRKYGTPWRFLYGMMSRESGADPAAVGSNGYDHGLVQVNLDPQVHPDISREQALTPSWSFGFAAGDMRKIHDRWKEKTTADPWDIAIANHNSPRLAQQWAETGKPPVVEGRVFQIEEYVIDIRTRGERA